PGCAAPPTPPPAPEERRIRALHALGILDTPAEALLDALVRAAAAACEAPVAVLNLLDRQRQWTKARIGLGGPADIPREESICTLVIEAGAYLEIPDTRRDARVAGRPCVLGEPALLFYAGAPLATREGEVIGTLAVLDHQPRAGLQPAQRAALQELAHAAMQALLLRQAAHRSVQSSSEQMFRELSEMAPVGIFHTDARGRVIYLNPQSLRIFGRTHDEMLGDDWARGVHPADVEGVVVRWRRAAAAGEVFDHTYRVLRGDGMLAHVRVRAQAVRLPDGSSGGYVGTLEDVTDSERSRAALERSQERLRRAIEASGLALWDLDVPGEAVYLSEHWSVMLGGEPRETRCTAQELLELVPMEDLPSIQAALEPVLGGRSPNYVVQHRVRRHDGSFLWIHSEGRVADRQERGAPLR
ncbi:MAG: PAS domain S-box protein, partial [Comamonadaceae bacterium]